MGNGVANDNQVTTANISSVTVLSISGEDIADLTGIEDFTALINLTCQYNNLTTLNLSNNHLLEVIRAYNNHLTSIQLGTNTKLEVLDIEYNQLTVLDVGAYTTLTSLYVDNNNLTICNIANGNNVNMSQMWIYNNPDLSCIQVDDPANTPPAGQDWSKDATATYSSSCPGVGVDELLESQIKIFPNPAFDFINIQADTKIDSVGLYTILGEKVLYKKIDNNSLNINITNIKTGMYVIKIKVNDKQFCKKIIVNAIQ
jgi:hypothetical protein